MEKVTGLVICRNEERNIGACLKSLEWCDETVVIDAFSEDRTIEIAGSFTHNIHLNEWKGFRDQRIFALSKVQSGWILSLDADERCTPELAREVRKVLASDKITESGFRIPRKSFFLGKWIKHGGWYPDYQLRLIREGRATVTDRLVHESYKVEGSIGKLESDIEHYTAHSVDEYLAKISKYADLSAIEKQTQHVGFFRLFIYPRLEFVKQYIFKGNFLDGKEGLMVSNFHMITKILTYMKVLEIQKK
jgi:glycosyltransferase involved in cell wall biosynthesis